MSKLKRTSKDRGQEVRWTPQDLWHVTVCFLGDLKGEESATAERVFREWDPTPFADLELRVQGMGAFPSTEETRVLWLGVQENQGFLNMQASLAAAVAAAGLPRAEREYRPHMTLARFRNPFNGGRMVDLGGRKKFGVYRVGELILFESVLQGNILKYVSRLRRGI